MFIVIIQITLPQLITIFIKANNEIDVVYIEKHRYFPIEIKWRNQLRSSDLKQIKKHPHGRIFAKTYAYGDLDGLSIEPLPWALIN